MVKVRYIAVCDNCDRESKAAITRGRLGYACLMAGWIFFTSKEVCYCSGRCHDENENRLEEAAKGTPVSASPKVELIGGKE